MEVDVGSDDGAGPSGDGFTAGSTDGGFKINIKNWHGVASWTWTTEDDLCGICHMALDGSAPGAPGPGDDSPVVWGRCTHYFHVHCIETWLNNKNTCPICRGKWVLANAPRPPPATPGNRSAAAPGPPQERKRDCASLGSLLSNASRLCFAAWCWRCLRYQGSGRGWQNTRGSRPLSLLPARRRHCEYGVM